MRSDPKSSSKSTWQGSNNSEPRVSSPPRRRQTGAAEREKLFDKTRSYDRSMPAVDADEGTVLYDFLKRKRWSEAITQINEVPSEAKTWIVEKNTDGSVRWRLLPLHQACELQPPVELVKALYIAFPAAVNTRDSGGDLPLHLACRERASKEVIDALIFAEPSSARVSDEEGRLPLHLACRQGAGIEIVDNLISSYIGGARKTDAYGLLPLHWACAQNATLPIVEALLQAHPDGTEVKDKWGRTPRSLALASTNPEKEEIIHALDRDPSFWTSNLIEEVSELKGKLDEKDKEEVEYQKKAGSLEQKLVEVTAASSAAAESFRLLKSELEAENKQLVKQLDELTNENERCEMKIDDLKQKNQDLSDKADELVSRLESVTGVFGSMEDQRMQILAITGQWEDSLQHAAEILTWDDHVMG